MIRWEEDYDENGKKSWFAYLGQAYLGHIESYSNGKYDLSFLRQGEDYSSLASAKRGAERMLKDFLREAGLVVKEAQS